MNLREQKGVESFKSGLNCAQSVISSFADDLPLNMDQALGMSVGFGAGMGRLQETCGAVTGAFMVLGLYNSEKYPDNKEKKEASYTMIQEFNKRFIALHGTTNCGSLTNCDLKTEEGQIYFRDNNLHEEVCEKCISTSVKVIEDLLKI